ncbi:NAD(P)-dependent alcohol dehydrogenase [Rhizorhabdus dicambivorans]|uniref:alcohol dehydrogenase n=1 Tax=Rhizorhabdus dicambivorans TaxID=1850238 RepID=A0A2A4FNP1_9SPHN|nr:NAD(P)-dependent alcohol dehydrogenase [Rhizorhabdus dicambivorans]ATE64381.1 NAD(P)-dependent alcohol dehydrogenase [Rhizorhabdus dicambivorans]PCE39709.1 NAD(P)-dependent alcohol dehydrogenase [Rhizorhabdus dicambivorans]
MRAVRFIESGRPPEIIDVAKPSPRPGEVLIKVGGAGVCHSDLHILDEGPRSLPAFTLGHENAGWIAELGDGVSGWKEGDAVAVYGPWGCGSCHACQGSAENHCEHHASLPSFGGGLGSDGGMADYMIVPSPRLLVPLGGLDPAAAAPLSDAALTPYHAIKNALPLLTPDATAVVVGVGGLGHMAVQILSALCPAQVIACDVDDSKLAHARELGATYVVNTSDGEAARAQILDIVGGRGVKVAFDFVAIQPTIKLCTSIVGRGGRISVVGMGGGTIALPVIKPYAYSIDLPYWGSRTELIEVIALAQAGRIKAEVETFPLNDALDVYQRLREGRVHGRAVLVP